MKIFQLLIAAVSGLIITWSGIMAANAQPQEIYAFSTLQQQQQFIALTSELRCLVCQNESLADSTASLANDLRAEIYRKIQAGDESATIKKYLVERYGQFILFKPAFNWLTFWLWILPIILLSATCVLLIIFMRTRRINAVPISLSAQEQQRLQQLLGNQK